VQIRDTMNGGDMSSCFHLLRSDGSVEDVSYRKCIMKLFPEMEAALSKEGRGGQQNGKGAGHQQKHSRGHAQRKEKCPW
jgi:hypothetical protein